jgi:hypothetical protein
MPFLKYASYQPKELTVECIRKFYGDKVFNNMGGADGMREVAVVRALLKHIDGKAEVNEGIPLPNCSSGAQSARKGFDKEFEQIRRVEAMKKDMTFEEYEAAFPRQPNTPPETLAEIEAELEKVGWNLWVTPIAPSPKKMWFLSEVGCDMIYVYCGIEYDTELDAAKAAWVWAKRQG